ncbi:MAG: VanZ family protein [Bacteroidota bacterium]
MNRRTALAALWTLVIFAGCSLPGDAIRSFDIFTPDKLYHIAAFVGYGLLWLWAEVRPKVVVVSGLAFALFIEAWQHVMPIGRFADPWDTLADAVGLGLALWTWHVARKAKEERMERAEQR